jgi:hypothetical protein
VDDNGGVTIGLTSALSKPKFAWPFNYYTGPENTDMQKGYRNLIDTALTLTPSSQLSAYINYDYLQNHSPAVFDEASAASEHLQGIAFAAHGALARKSSLTGRFEYFDDNEGFTTGTAQSGPLACCLVSSIATTGRTRRSITRVTRTEGAVDADCRFQHFFGPKR